MVAVKDLITMNGIIRLRFYGVEDYEAEASGDETGK